ncbi:MAG: hypothetical protein BRD40_04385 [Bacteroidetes bacterium QS_1_65_9]|nr:MAG: hypothetical protein BRD40_04385 [Bacteroidetes bacterium QS_1_65_9]
MSDTNSTEKRKEPDEKDSKEPSGTTLTLEGGFEELNSCDRLHQYAKKRKQEKSGKEKRKEPREGTLTEEEWIELMNKYDRLSQYAKRRKEKESGKGGK